MDYETSRGKARAAEYAHLEAMDRMDRTPSRRTSWFWQLGQDITATEPLALLAEALPPCSPERAAFVQTMQDVCEAEARALRFRRLRDFASANEAAAFGVALLESRLPLHRYALHDATELAALAPAA